MRRCNFTSFRIVREIAHYVMYITRSDSYAPCWTIIVIVQDNHPMLTEFIYYESEESWYILNHFHNGMLPSSYSMLPPSVANVIKLGPENISGERIIYHIDQITHCCSRSGNCLVYGTPCGDLTRMFSPANLLFVQYPSICWNKSPTVRFLLTIKIQSCFIRSLEFARVNNSAALTDVKLPLDVFEKLSSDLVLMSAIQSMITFPAFLPVLGIYLFLTNLLHRIRQCYMDFFSRQQKVWYTRWVR